MNHAPYCDCEVIEIDAGHVSEHEGDGPRAYDHVRAADDVDDVDDITAFRQCLKMWNEDTGIEGRAHGRSPQP